MTPAIGDDGARNPAPHYSDYATAEIRALKRAIHCQPDRAELYAQVAEFCAGEHDWETAIAAYRQAIRCDPDNGDYHHWVGILFLELDRLEEALDPFRAAARLDPGNELCQFNLAETLMKLGRHEEAITSFADLLCLAPEDATPDDARAEDDNEWGAACGYFALLLLRAGLLPEMVIRLQEAVRRHPELAAFRC
jgi:tetratricopeptide (TPR) repeat protein